MNKPAIHAMGCGALLLDVGAGGVFDEYLQQRIWQLSELLDASRNRYCVQDILPGVNNLLVLFDPLACPPSTMRDALTSLWHEAKPREHAGRVIEIPVTYGGECGEDLADAASAAGLSVADYVELHSGAEYRVACIGAMAGFAYLTGLPSRLHRPRRATPRMQVPKGAVIVGGAQAGVMPVTAPSGWYAIGSTEAELFDPLRKEPCLMRAGDRVHFRLLRIES